MVTKRKYLNFYFLCSFVLIFLVLIFKFPTLGINAEVFAEAGTNFFLNAKVTPFVKSLTISDAGYLPLVQRLFSEVILKIFHLEKYFPIITQIFSLIVISFCASFINFKLFRQLIPSDGFRFVSGLVLGFYPDYDMYSYINFVYFGYIYLVLLLFISFYSVSWSLTFFLGICGFLFVTSKALLLAVAPFFGLLMLFSIIRKQKKEFVVSGLITLGAIIQSSFVLFNLLATNLSKVTSPERDTLNLISVGFHLLVSLFVENLLPFFYYMDADTVSFFILSLLYIILGYLLWRNKKRKIFLSLFVLPLIAFVSVLFFLKFIGDDSFPRFNHFVFQKPVYLRWFFIGHESVLLLFLLCLGQVTKNWLRFTILLLFLMYFPNLRLFAKLKDNYEDSINGRSNWEVFYKLSENESFCIPINPATWYISHQCVGVQKSEGQEVLAIEVNHTSKEKAISPEIQVLNSDNQIVSLNKISEKNGSTYWLVDNPSKTNRVLISEKNFPLSDTIQIVYYVKNK